MCGYNWAFNPLAIAYPVEFLPYNVRTVGLSWLMLWCTVVGFANTWVNPVGLDTINWRYYIAYVVWLVFEFIVVFLTFPETLGYALEEVSAILDNDRFFSFKYRTGKKQIVVLQEGGITFDSTTISLEK